jgi:PGF-pre-PGF domain-containing protein
MKNKARTMLLTFIILIASATVVSAGTETQITQNERLTSGTSFYGDYVYWTESTGNDVHAYDLITGKRTDISGHFAYNQIASYGNKVVWAGDGGEAVYMYDISTGNETKITPSGNLPDIYGNYVVYNYYNQDHKNDSIYLYDINTGNETKIATVYGYPAIYDKTVVWSQANSSDGYDICKYDISTNQTSIITTTNSSIPESELDIYGDTVVWTESHNLYMYDTAFHKKTQITNSGNAYEPAIYGNWIACECGSGDNRGIYTYEISTARTTRIATSSAHGPSIYGDNIIYIDSRNPETDPDVRDIYLYNLSDTSTSDNIVANFTSNVTSGIAPLIVSFTDISTGAPDSWQWNFGDGAISTLQNPIHTYGSPGNYVVNLTSSNENVTASKTATITVLESSSSDDSESSGGSSHSSSGGSGGAGGSPEPAKNVEVKELSQVFITNGKTVKFDFTKNATAIVYISFDSKKTAGKTTTIVEMLKNQSTLTPDVPRGEVYNYLNIWVGNGGYGSDENNLENAVICFKVEKSWAQDKNIDQSSITLNRHSNKTWEQLPVSLLKEDDKYLYFTARTPGFSPFAIIGKTKVTENEIQSAVDNTQNESTSENMAINVEQISEQNQNLNASGKESTKMPGFEIAYGIVCLISVFLFKRK